MTDFMLAGLSAGLFTFLALFIISFIALGMITGLIHLVTLAYRSLVVGKTPAYKEQAV
jgi:hypothetical protein